jgi:tryptophan-rich sensory protein
VKVRDAVALGAPLVVGAIGSIPTARAIPTWYRALRKPPWNPPNAIFGPVWTTLYALMGVALLLVRRVDGDRPRRERAQAIFALQLALNLAWSLVFFGARDLRGALAVIAALWVSILATIASFWGLRRAAAVLLVPYLAWVSFAAVLNAEIARRNPAREMAPDQPI